MISYADKLIQGLRANLLSQPPCTGTDVHLMSEALAIILRPMIKALIQMEGCSFQKKTKYVED